MTFQADDLEELVLKLVRFSGQHHLPDISLRQLYLLLRMTKPQTVRGVATELGIARPVVVRAMNRLVEMGLAQRLPDTKDRRSTWLTRTMNGDRFVQRVLKINDVREP